MPRSARPRAIPSPTNPQASTSRSGRQWPTPTRAEAAPRQADRGRLRHDLCRHHRRGRDTPQGPPPKRRRKCRAVADSLDDAGTRLRAFARLDPSQWNSARTTDAIERRTGEVRRHSPRPRPGCPAPRPCRCCSGRCWPPARSGCARSTAGRPRLSPSSRCRLTPPPETPNLHSPAACRQGMPSAFATRPSDHSENGSADSGPLSASRLKKVDPRNRFGHNPVSRCSPAQFR